MVALGAWEVVGACVNDSSDGLGSASWGSLDERRSLCVGGRSVVGRLAVETLEVLLLLLPDDDDDASPGSPDGRMIPFAEGELGRTLVEE